MRTKSDAELDKLAHDLDTLVGVAAEAELTRRRLRRTWIIGSILLAIFCGWALYATIVRDKQDAITRAVVRNNERAIEAERRNAAAAHRFDRISCARDRETTRQLRIIIRRGLQSLKQLRADGAINERLYRAALRQNHAALKQLPPVECPPGR